MRDLSNNIVDCKWLYWIKQKVDGSIDSFKARLVAKAFMQRPSLDFHETFSPVVKPTMVRLVLSIVLQHNWPIHELDVNNSFLQGKLDEEVFVSQPKNYQSSIPESCSWTMLPGRLASGST